eukprot:scaffold4026_cov117-Cylindrotheca_fusiformis.AAC.37
MFQQKDLLSFEEVPTAVIDDVSKNPTVIESTWYLGGNHNVNLLFSVDGDLDPQILKNLTAVPSVVGELALSVESLVSHDLTVGGFENDILAKITLNTLASRQSTGAETPSNAVTTDPNKPQRSPSMESFSVPNPLADSNYKPVPNPLSAPVTPPDSPIPGPSPATAQVSRKRKSPSSVSKVAKAGKTKVSSRPAQQ